MNNNQQLIDLIKYSDLENGTVVIRVGNTTVFGQIQELEVSMKIQNYTHFEIKGIIADQ